MLDYLRMLATEGLRTLCCATVDISEAVYQQWRTEYDVAKNSIINREMNVEAIAVKIERNLNLLGVTGIEDTLQDGVPDTIEALLKAGIKIWVLTGDKRETAMNVGYCCKLIEANMTVIVLNEDNDQVSIT